MLQPPDRSPASSLIPSKSILNTAARVIPRSTYLFCSDPQAALSQSQMPHCGHRALSDYLPLMSSLWPHHPPYWSSTRPGLLLPQGLCTDVPPPWDAFPRGVHGVCSITSFKSLFKQAPSLRGPSRPPCLKPQSMPHTSWPSSTQHFPLSASSQNILFYGDRLPVSTKSGGYKVFSVHRCILCPQNSAWHILDAE